MNLWKFLPLIVVVILGCKIGTTLNSASIRERIQISAQLFSGWKTIPYRSNSQSLQVIVCKASGIRDNSSLYKTNCCIERGRTSWEEVARRSYNWYFHINWSQLYFYNYMTHVQLVTLGVMKTLRKIQQKYYWLGQRKDVEEWCRQCKVCASRKSPSTHPKAPMQTYTSANPMDGVAMDLLGPLPVTPQGNRYILTIEDYFTKWTEAYSMQDMEASTVANIFYNFVCRFGAPVYLHTDQRRNLSPN